MRLVWAAAAAMLCTTACGQHASRGRDAGAARAGGTGGGRAAGRHADAAVGAGGAGHAADASQAGTGGTPGTLMFACSEAQPSTPIQCGQLSCEQPAPTQLTPCVAACCTTLEGRDRCGVRDTALGFSSDCVLPAVFDPSCDEVVQFPGCCDLTQHKCGIMAGLRPGCVTESSFVTLPKSPKSCGLTGDAGTDHDAG